MRVETVRELIKEYKERYPDHHFFDDDTMAFFGDHPQNFGIRYLNDVHEGAGVIELYRKKPVKHGLFKSHYFSARDYRELPGYKPGQEY